MRYVGAFGLAAWFIREKSVMWNKDARSRCVRALLAGGVVFIVAAAIRYGLLENGVLPRDCGVFPAEAPFGACGFKWALVQSFLHQRIGWVSLLCGASAFFLDRRKLAWVGWFAGIAGLVLYSYDPAAVGALLSLLVLVRPAGRRGTSTGSASARPVSSQPMA